jgi:thioredoxin-like negative regulator of GroEL
LARNLEEANLSIPIEVVDIDVNSDLAVDYGIRGVPTLVLTDGTVEIKRVVGLKTSTELKEWATV